MPASGIFCLNISKDDFNFMDNIHLFPWSSSMKTPESTQCSKSVQADIKSLPQICSWSGVKVNTPIQTHFNCALPAPNDLEDVYLDIPKHLKLNYENSEFLQKMIDDFEMVLEQAVFKRVNNQPNMCQNCIKQSIMVGISTVDLRSNKPDLNLSCMHSKIAILFSGGLDSTVLCVLADR